MFAFLAFRSLLGDPYQCDFKCWINKLNVTIDYVETQTSWGFLYYNITLKNLSIHNMDLISIHAENYPHPDVVEDDLYLSIKINAAIDGHLRVYQTAPTHSFDQSGSFSASAAGAQFKIGLHFEKDEHGLIKRVSISQGTCGASVDRIDDPVLHIDTSAFLDWLINLVKGIIVGVIKNNIGSMVCNNIQEELSTAITNGFKQANDIIIPYLNYTKPIDIPIGPNMTDMRKSQFLDVIRFMLTNFTGTNGPLNLNSLANKFTNGTGYASLASILSYLQVDVPLAFSIPIPSVGAKLNLSLLDLHLTGLNTWDDFTILDPISEYIVDSHTGMESLGINISFQINVSTNSSLISTGDVYLSETADLDIALSHNKMDLKMQLASPEGAGFNYSNSEAIELGCIETLLSPNGTGITYLLFNTTINHLSLEASTHEMELEIRNFINTVVKFFIDNYRPVIPTFVTGFVNYFGTNQLNDLIDNELAKAECKHIKDSPYYDYTLWVSVTAAVLSIGLVIVIFCIMPKKPAEKVDDEDSFSYRFVSHESLESLERPLFTQRMIDEPKTNIKTAWDKFWRTDADASLLMTPKLSLFTRLLLPLFVFMNIAVFVSSNTGVGASVFAKIFLGEKHVAFPSIEDFSLINSVREMWEAKTYALSILIAVMSCAWPYTKLIMMLMVWILPGPIMHAKRRETFLKFLDALGKWSLVDSFVMVLMLIAFNFDVYFPIVSSQVDTGVSVHLWVYPAYGFLTLMLGTVISLALSHIMLAVERYADYPQSSDDGPIAKKRFSVMNLSEMKKLTYFTGGLLVISLGLVGVGIYVRSFGFDFVGLIGYALDMLDDPHEKEYSVIDLAIDLPNAAENPNQFTIRFTQALFILVVIIMPITHIITQTILLFVPLSKKVQRGFYVACEVMYAWNCLDVFIISILAAVAEISQFAAFMVGDKCDVINPILRMFFKDEDLIKGHEVCFDVITKLEKGSWILFAAAILHTIATILLGNISERVITQRNGDSMDSSAVSFVR